MADAGWGKGGGFIRRAYWFLAGLCVGILGSHLFHGEEWHDIDTIQGEFTSSPQRNEMEVMFELHEF